MSLFSIPVLDEAGYNISSQGGDRHRSERLRVSARGTMFKFRSTGLAYVWHGYIAFTGRIRVGYHLSSFGNRKVLALEDGRETF